MGAIAGVLSMDGRDQVIRMLNCMNHGSGKCVEIIDCPGGFLGTLTEPGIDPDWESPPCGVCDYVGNGQFAQAAMRGGDLMLERDELGVEPLYYDLDEQGVFYFASEVKALATIGRQVRELPPGCTLSGDRLHRYYKLEQKEPLPLTAELWAMKLSLHLEQAIVARMDGKQPGAWLSGGIDSSAIAALAKPHIPVFHTFVAGVKDAPDIRYAQQVANFIGSEHHEVIVTRDDLFDVLPQVIFHLESFDALLVRSSITNYLVAKESSNYVDEVFSGEGGDEFFAGYLYLKNVPSEKLDGELVRIAMNMHNTAFQRVHRCASAHGLKAHVVFADPNVFELALQIPSSLKIKDGVEKWILRQAVSGILPHEVLWRTKSKFWEGAGVQQVVADYAGKSISDHDFRNERRLFNGWILESKEELLYYRLFKEHFGGLTALDWMGRTVSQPHGER